MINTTPSPTSIPRETLGLLEGPSYISPRNASLSTKMMHFDALLDSQIGEILETRDAMDSSRFDPADYVNNIFPNGIYCHKKLTGKRAEPGDD